MRIDESKSGAKPKPAILTLINNLNLNNSHIFTVKIYPYDTNR